MNAGINTFNSNDILNEIVSISGRRQDTELTIGDIISKLKETGVEVTPDHKIVLYHVTSGKNLLSILLSGAIKPAVDTGNRTWRLPGEEDSGKPNKVYLTKLGTRVFTGVRNSHNGTTYTLKVYIRPEDFGNLRIDEDDIHANNFLDSLSGNVGTCSYFGSLTDFEVVRKQGFTFSVLVEHLQEYKDFFDNYIEIYDNLNGLKKDLVLLEKYLGDPKNSEETIAFYREEILEVLSMIKKSELALEKYSIKSIVRQYNRLYDEKIAKILANRHQTISVIEGEKYLYMSTEDLYNEILNIMKCI